jgi:uncharacterized protein involved in type VI secretion and phage assembly
VERFVYSGFVTSTEDPKGLGRVQVELQGFDEALELPWIRTVQTTASGKHGHMFMPEDGDEVMVLKGAGDDFDGMVILGCVYNGSNKPNEANNDGDNHTKQIRTRSGHELTFYDEDGSEKITIKTPDGKLSIEMDHAGVEIKVNSEDKITISATSKVAVDAQEVTIEGANKVDIKSSAQVNVDGGQQVSVSATAISLSGTTVSIG